jgi:protein involved in polysaccharide export with SLBB domain
MFGNIVRIKSILIILLGFLLYAPALYGQQVTEEEAKEMLADRGIPEDTLRTRLIEKGYDPDNISPDQLGDFQEVIIATVQEIEADMAARDALDIPKPKESINSPATEPAVEAVEEKPEKMPVDPSEPKIYGQEIFRNNAITVYKNAGDLSAPDTYILGTGDKIGVIGFGRSQFEHLLEIDQDGFAKPSEKLPKILLRGVRLGDAKELLYQRYSQNYIINRGEFQVALNKSRNMTINVFGEAKSTGSYTLPGINTAFNVISAAGGPTDIGSVRRIKVIRGDKTIPLDVYEFMNDPGIAKDYFLQNNDYIHIPVAQKVVSIKGAVVRPMTYELLDEENLSQLLAFAGGAKANAYLSSVQITRYMNDGAIITNVNLKDLADSGGDYVLFNGDVVEIKTIAGSVQNTVTVDGAVKYPGIYERREGMNVTDLLNQSIIRPDARLDFAYLLHYEADGTYRYQRINLQEVLDNPASASNVVLTNLDLLQIMTLKTYVEQGTFSVIGAVHKPDTFTFNPDGRVRLEDAVLLAGGALNDASEYGYLLRRDPKEPKRVEYIHLDLKEAIEEPFSVANVIIKAGDQINIFSKGGRRDEITVSIFGAVRTPGVFAYGEGMRLADLISLAGGFKFEADNERIDIARSIFYSENDIKVSQYTASLARDFELNYDRDTSTSLTAFDHVFVRSIPEFELQRTVRIEGAVKYPGSYTLLKAKEKIYDVIERAGGLSGQAFPEGAKLFRQGDGTGLVVIDLHDILKNSNIPSNITLRGGDVIEIPKSRALVTIDGHINLDDAYSNKFLKGGSSISIAYRGAKSARYYVNNFAAGVSTTGTMNKLKVQYADGRVQKTGKFLFVFNKHPKVRKGSVITVGAKKVKPPRQKSEKKNDWGLVLRDTLYQATAILTLLILVDQLSK